MLEIAETLDKNDTCIYYLENQENKENWELLRKELLPILIEQKNTLLGGVDPRAKNNRDDRSDMNSEDPLSV